MKRNYAALMLGLTLAISSFGVQAEEVNISADSIAVEEVAEDASVSEDEAGMNESSDETVKEPEAIYGKVVSIDETGITIELGERSVNEDMEATVSENDITEDKAAEDEMMEENNRLDPEAEVVSETADVSLLFHGVNQIFDITADTVATLSYPVVGEDTLKEKLSDEEILIDEAAEDISVDEGTETDHILIPAYEEWESNELSLTDVQENDLVKLTFDDNGAVAVINVILLDE